MNELIVEQVERAKAAKIRAKAEKDVLRQMLPETVQSDLHYNGSTRAKEKNPEYANAIDMCSS
jgi:hypothetical protein